MNVMAPLRLYKWRLPRRRSRRARSFIRCPGSRGRGYRHLEDLSMPNFSCDRTSPPPARSDRRRAKAELRSVGERSLQDQSAAPRVNIGRRAIGAGCPTYVIAGPESTTTARPNGRCGWSCRVAGARCVKFQVFRADELTTQRRKWRRIRSPRGRARSARCSGDSSVPTRLSNVLRHTAAVLDRVFGHTL